MYSTMVTLIFSAFCDLRRKEIMEKVGTRVVLYVMRKEARNRNRWEPRARTSSIDSPNVEFFYIIYGFVYVLINRFLLLFCLLECCTVVVRSIVVVL